MNQGIGMDDTRREKLGIFAVNLGLFSNIVLAIAKMTGGIVGHSPALLADGINSTSDVAYYVIVRIFMGLSTAPADEEHPYGHRQLESISALVVGAFVITTAIAIFWDAVNRIYEISVGTGSFAAAAPWALIVAMVTVVVKIGLTFVTTGIGKKTSNPAVLALALDHRNDIFAAAAAGAGIILSQIGISWGDPLAGAVVALVILKTGIEIVRESSGDLMDTVPGRLLEEQVRHKAGAVSGVQSVEEVLAHRFGPYIVMNLTIGVDGSMTVAAGDAIASTIERVLCTELEMVRRVHVHVHPRIE